MQIRIDLAVCCQHFFRCKLIRFLILAMLLPRFLSFFGRACKAASRLYVGVIPIGQGSGSSLDEKPDWEKNQQTARMISGFQNQRAENLCRGVKLKSGRYNQQAATPSILVEVGNNQNTLQEALNAAGPLARAICLYFDTLSP